jgi:heat shock protein HtpX
VLNVYEQVSINKTRSVIVIALFITFVLGVSYLITYTLDLDPSIIMGAFIFSTFSAIGSYFFGDKIVLGLNGAREAQRKEFFNYYTVTENLSLASQIPVPKMYVIDSPALNAFATGRDPQHAVICVTTGLLEKLSRTQLEGVIAHELSHVVNYDIRLMMLVSILVGSLSILSDLLLRGHARSRNRNRSSGMLALVGFILILFSPLIAQLIQLALSRQREFLADASGVKLTRQPSGLIEALTIIATDPNHLQNAAPSTAPLFISNPFKGQTIATLFSTHPPIEQRIATLQKML